MRVGLAEGAEGARRPVESLGAAFLQSLGAAFLQVGCLAVALHPAAEVDLADSSAEAAGPWISSTIVQTPRGHSSAI